MSKQRELDAVMHLAALKHLWPEQTEDFLKFVGGEEGFIKDVVAGVRSLQGETIPEYSRLSNFK